MTNEIPQQPRSVKPPADVFRTRPMMLEDRVMESSPVHIFTGKITVPPEGGMNLHFKDVPYPKKGFPFLEATVANNTVKRYTMSLLLSVATKEMALPFLAFVILPYRVKEKAISNFLWNYCRFADHIFDPFYLEHRFMTPCSNQIRMLAYNFLTTCGMTEASFRSEGHGINMPLAGHFGMVLAMLFEYDDAYRYYLEDVMSETTPGKFAHHPVREIWRLTGLLAKRHRDGAKVSRKFKAVAWVIIAFLIRHPRLRKAWKTAVMASDFKRLQLDEADRYHCLMRDDYDFFGLPVEEREKEYDAIHKGKYPPMYRYEAPEQ